VSGLYRFKKRANSFAGFALLLFNENLDICNPNQAIAACAYGKISVIKHIPPFHQHTPPNNTTKWHINLI
jgi:hypothetical protein